MPTPKNVLKLGQLSKKLDKLRAKNKIGYISGAFDVLHVGHLEFLEWAKGQCDILIVAVSNDNLVKVTKGQNRPIFTQSIRCSVLSSVRYIDYILATDNPPFASGTTQANEYLLEVSNKLKPDIFFVNTLVDKSAEAKKMEAKLIGAKFVEYLKPQTFSATKIIEKIISME